MIRLPVLLLFLLFHLFILPAVACPPLCICRDDRHVDCADRFLTSVPDGIPAETESLDLAFNSLSSLSIDRLAKLGNLRRLKLAHNLLRDIDDDDANMLHILPNLEELDLSDNRLTWIPLLAEERSETLKTLNLAKNRIRDAHAADFVNLPELLSLDLSHNRLRIVQPDVLHRLPLLTSLNLEGNPFKCGCKSAILLEALVERRLATDLRCFDAEEMERSVAAEIGVNHLNGCGRHRREIKAPIAQQKTTRAPEVLATIRDNPNLTTVTAPPSSSTTPTPKAKPTTTTTTATTTAASEKTTTMPTTTTFSSPISAAQKFLQTPVDQNVRIGETLVLNCQVEGGSKTALEWRHNSQMLTSSRRHTISDGQLKIYPVAKDDEGSYECVARSEAGESVKKSAKITIIQESTSGPHIFDAPASATVQPGNMHTFRCAARGTPPATLKWYFDGRALESGLVNIKFLHHNSELVIETVARQHAGNYTCQASNEIGIASASAILTVEAPQQKTVDEAITKDVLERLVGQARKNIEESVARQESDIAGGVYLQPRELLRRFRFSGPQMEMTKSREIYEESLRLVQQFVQNDLRLDPTQMFENVSYESVLPPKHVHSIMELSGCVAGIFVNPCSDWCFHSKYRSYDGQCNNIEKPLWGTAQMPFRRILPPRYENGFNQPIGWNPDRLYNGFRKPNARSVSLKVVGSPEISSHPKYSAMLFQWGQWTDHDLTLTAPGLTRHIYASGQFCNRTCENLDPCFNIQLPPEDPRLLAASAKNSTAANQTLPFPCIEFERSSAVCGSGETSVLFQQVTQREQMNVLTAFIDASNVYGNHETDSLDLRDLYSDHGLLRFDIVSAAQKPYLPFEKDSSMDCRRVNRSDTERPIPCFLAGDFRANEQLALLAMHTIWLREHNRIATRLLQLNAHWDGERIFQETRKIVGAQMQHITYSQWLPKVLGAEGFDALIGPYRGYEPEVEPTIANEFANAAFRFGHTIINPVLQRLNASFQPIPEGHIRLRDAFFNPGRLLSEGGVDPLMRGLFAAPLKQPRADQMLTDELTNRLYFRAHEVTQDLAALNVQRGRDHAFPGWTEYRRWCNLSVPESWHDVDAIIVAPNVSRELRELYGHPANIDLWVGCASEPLLPGALVGATFSCLIADQFRRLRAGDRLWYERAGVFSDDQLRALKKGATLGRVLCQNGDAIDRVPDDVFLYQNPASYRNCSTEIQDLNLAVWMECCSEGCASTMSRFEPAERDPHKSAPPPLQRKRRAAADCGAYRHGTSWSTGKCEHCRCENGNVLCTTDDEDCNSAF